MTSRDTSAAGGTPSLSIASGLFATVKAVKYEHLLAGISGGVVSTLLLHPLDLLKIRFAVDDGQAKDRPKYIGLRHGFSTVLRHEGFKGLYKGVIPNVTGAATAWGFYFLL
jgi:solute carrier family 25 folate transporter 32